MAFTDLPLIYAPSANSELSDRAVCNFLNQHSGFICRRDTPDKGCDLDAELILNGKSAANRRFGIQLKSVESLPLLADGQTISYQFETGRLSYLLNRPVGEGLIIIYDVAAGHAYFEYALIVYQKLMEERGESWYGQDTVNIRIPLSNLLDINTAGQIHTYFRERFETVACMIASQGPRYGMASMAPPGDNRLDIPYPSDPF
jgi:hypothetical protein